MAKVKLLIKAEILGFPYKKGDIVDVGGVYADKLVNNKIATLDLSELEVKAVNIELSNESKSSQ